MKFTDGFWLLREGVRLFHPAEIRDAEVSERGLTLFTACKTVRHRGDTLNEPLLSIEFFAQAKDVIRVKVRHHAGGRETGPQFSVNADADHSASVEKSDEGFRLTSGDLSVGIGRGTGWNIEYSYRGTPITGNTPKSTGYVTCAGGEKYIREQLNLGVGELIYGLGERFTPFVKNGQSIEIWNEDGGTCSEQAYKNIPLYLSNRGYGVFVNHPERVSFEVASENVSKVQFSVSGESLEYFIIGGRDMKHVLENYTSLTGKPALPPAWSFGLWLTTSFTTSYDEKTINSFIDGMADRDIPLRVFHFDCFWMKEYEWCNYEWDKAMFPEPEQMLKRLKERGLKICLWINSYIAQKSPLFEEARKNGYLLKKPNGDIWQWDMWQAGMGLIDFTHPGAVSWFKDKLRKLLVMGVDCFKSDFGERIPTDVVYFDGSDPRKMHNYYTFLYNKAVFEVIKEEKGGHEAVLFARSATAGSQQFPVHWGGDCSATYASMAESLRGGLSLCLSGFGFWSHDIGGFENRATPDIYKRWVAFGLLSSHSRLHGSESYRVPWLFDEESVDVLRFFTKLKCRLMPYLFAAAVSAAERGVPVMRAMVMEFSQDPACGYLDTQYMLGDSLLIAPVFNEEGIASYYLPQGVWTDFISGRVQKGGRWIKEKHGYLSIPMLVRQNTILALGSQEQRPDYDYAEGIEFHMFELRQDCEASTAVYTVLGEKTLTARAVRSGQQIEFVVDGAVKPWRLMLRNSEDIASVKGGRGERCDKGCLVIPDAPESVLVITVA